MSYPIVNTQRPRYMTSMTCVDSGWATTACTAGWSGSYREPLHAQCAYCRTRYYLSAGDRMNCTQCGAPL